MKDFDFVLRCCFSAFQFASSRLGRGEYEVGVAFSYPGQNPHVFISKIKFQRTFELTLWNEGMETSEGPTSVPFRTSGGRLLSR